MPHKIGIDAPAVQIGGDRTVQRTESAAAVLAAAKPQADTTESVHITGAAKNLAALEQTLKDQPVVDEARVTRLQAAIGNGQYQVDAARVADKLLRFEEQLGSDGK